METIDVKRDEFEAWADTVFIGYDFSILEQDSLDNEEIDWNYANSEIDSAFIAWVARQQEIDMKVARIAQLEQERAEREAQEPVAWIEHHKGGDNMSWDEIEHGYAKPSPLYANPMPPAHEWQPIETAPKNVDVLVFDKNEGYMSCCAVAGQSTDGIWTISDSEEEIVPSHWMPLPKASA